MMAIGIGGAGGKVAAKLDPNATLVNVSETELNKVVGVGKRIVAPVHAANGQFRGSRKNPEIGRDAYFTIRRELHEIIRGNMLFCSTGGGTGNGITSGLLKDVSAMDDIPVPDKTFFNFVLPYGKLESAEFVKNTIDFMTGPLALAIDSGNTGNIVLFSNRMKFIEKIAEDRYNQMMIDSLNVLLAVPQKNDSLRLLDGHIDHEDFTLFISKPYLNHFNYFTYDPKESFSKQLEANSNPLLLPSEDAIEALFLLEIPQGGDSTIFYDILQYFDSIHVSPVYSVVENPAINEPFITVSRLYSRKPAELVSDYNRINEMHVQATVEKSLDQHVELQKLEVDMEDEAKKVGIHRGVEEDVLATLKRLRKL